MTFIQQPNKKLACWVCKKPISGARTVIDGMWHCADCTYRHDHPGKEIPEPVKPWRPAKQKETLFPLPEKVRE